MRQLNHRFYPGSVLAASLPYELAIFNPFDNNNDAGTNLIVLDEPISLMSHLLGQPITPKRPAQKHRIRIDLLGLSPKSVKTEISEDKSKLVVNAKEGERKENDDEDYYVRELRRTFKLPSNVDADKMTSFVTRNGEFVIDFPLKQEEEKPKVAKRVEPEETESEERNKKVKLSFELPPNIDASKIKVTCRDRDVVVEIADQTHSQEGGTSQIYFYRRNTLPENADVEALKCLLENNTLIIEAPRLIGQIPAAPKTIPIESQRKEESLEKMNEKQSNETQNTV